MMAAAIQLSRTIRILLIVILGGAKYFWGPLLGTVIAVWLDVIVSQMTPRYNTVIGIVFLAVVLLAPNGMLGCVDDVRNGVRLPRIRKWWDSIAPKDRSRDSSISDNILGRDGMQAG